MEENRFTPKPTHPLAEISQLLEFHFQEADRNGNAELAKELSGMMLMIDLEMYREQGDLPEGWPLFLYLTVSPLVMATA